MKEFLKKLQAKIPKKDELGPYFSKNKKYFMIGGACVCLLLVAGIIFTLTGREDRVEYADTDGPVSGSLLHSESEELQMLPQNVTDRDRWGDMPPDPFAGQKKLTGVILGGYGGNHAIIETGGADYVVAEGDTIDNFWTVQEILSDRVILVSGEHTEELELTRQVVARSEEESEAPRDTVREGEEAPEAATGDEDGAVSDDPAPETQPAEQETPDAPQNGATEETAETPQGTDDETPGTAEVPEEEVVPG